MNATARRRILYHACFRCRGDLLLDEDQDYSCLQCGRSTPLDTLVERGLVPDSLLAGRRTPGWLLIADSNEVEEVAAA